MGRGHGPGRDRVSSLSTRGLAAALAALLLALPAGAGRLHVDSFARLGRETERIFWPENTTERLGRVIVVATVIGAGRALPLTVGNPPSVGFKIDECLRGCATGKELVVDDGRFIGERPNPPERKRDDGRRTTRRGRAR